MNRKTYNLIPKLQSNWKVVWSDCSKGHLHPPRVYSLRYWPVGGKAPCGLCRELGIASQGVVTVLSMTETYDPACK